MKTFIVTGASRGIGYHTVLKLANLGHRVIATARSSDKLESLANESNQGAIIPVVADLTRTDGIKAIITSIPPSTTIDGLINNAGYLVNKTFADTTLDEWKRVFDVNFFAVTQLIKEVIPFMKAGAHVLNISSMGGYQGSAKFAGLSAYSASKGALAILTECLSEELKENRISVNCLCLGAVQTEMLEDAFPGYSAPVQANEMGEYISDFIMNGHRFYNGKILPVALNNPD